MNERAVDPRMDAKVLRRAAELVLQGHCKGAFAVTSDGCHVYEDHPQAVAWCARGALYLAELEILNEGGERHLALCDSLKIGMVEDWNDAPERTADEVAAALREAAERCERSAAA